MARISEYHRICQECITAKQPNLLFRGTLVILIMYNSNAYENVHNCVVYGSMYSFIVYENMHNVSIAYESMHNCITFEILVYS